MHKEIKLENYFHCINVYVSQENCIYLWLLSHIIIVKTNISSEREMNPIISPFKKNLWDLGESNLQQANSKSLLCNRGLATVGEKV